MRYAAHAQRSVVPRAAPEHAVGGRSTLACAILPVRVRTPLPHVAQHVVETPTVGLLQGNRMGLSATVLGVPGNLVQVSIRLPPIRPGTRIPIAPRSEARAEGRGSSPRSGSGNPRRPPSSPAPRGDRVRGTGLGFYPSPLPREPGCTASRTSRSRSRSRPHAAGPRHPIVLPRYRASP